MIATAAGWVAASPTASARQSFSRTEALAGGRMGQIYVSRNGRTLLNTGHGAAPDGTRVRADHLVAWASAVKPATVAAVMRLVEAGRVRLDDPVSRHIPGFEQNGKAGVRVEHLMTHSAFLGGYDGPTNLPAFEVTIARIMKAPRELTPAMAQTLGRGAGLPPPGKATAYNPAGIWILGEILQRVHNRPFWQVMRTEMYEPCGMLDSWNGMPAHAARRYGERLAVLQNGAMAFRGGAAAPAAVRGRGAGAAGRRRRVRAAAGAVQPRLDEGGVSPSNPAGGGVGPCSDLGRFYEMMLAGGEIGGRRILRRETVQEMTRLRLSDGGRWSWGLGLNLNTPPAAPGVAGRYPAKASPRAYGHAGASGIMAFADPAHRLTVVTIPADAVLEAIYADLNLA